MKTIIIILITVFLTYKFFYTVPASSKYEEITIKELVSDSRRYDSKVFRVKGVVSNPINIAGVLKGFKLKSENTNDFIYIITQKAVPQANKRIEITGVFEQKLKISDKEILTITEN